MRTPLKKGERIRILPEWQDKGDADRKWYAYEDEHGGRVGIFTPLPQMAFQPWQTVESRMVESMVPVLAAAFCAILNEWLTPEQIDETVKLNAIEATNQSGVCHSHDHCDANQAMLDAWEQVFGKDEAPACITKGTSDVEKNRDDQLWNMAWALAKAKGFKCNS